MTQLGPRVTALFLLSFLAVTPAAATATPVAPEEFSAADQYVESVPTSGGPKPAKKGQTEQGSKGAGDLPVPPAVEELDGSLREVATSAELGAPEHALPDRGAQEPSVPSAAVSALDEGEGGRLLWLLVALVVISGAIAGTATYRHRARRKATGS